MEKLWQYPFKVWITSVLVGPILLLILVMNNTKDLDSRAIGGSIQFYLIALLIAGFFSTPCFFFLWMCYSLLVKWNCKEWIIRIALLFVSILTCIAVFACFSLMDRQSFWHMGNLKLVGAFALPLAFGVIVYKLKQ